MTIFVAISIIFTAVLVFISLALSTELNIMLDVVICLALCAILAKLFKIRPINYILTVLFAIFWGVDLGVLLYQPVAVNLFKDHMQVAYYGIIIVCILLVMRIGFKSLKDYELQNGIMPKPKSIKPNRAKKSSKSNHPFGGGGFD